MPGFNVFSLFDWVLGRRKQAESFQAVLAKPIYTVMPQEAVPEDDTIRTDGTAQSHVGQDELDGFGGLPETLQKAILDLYIEEPAMRSAVDGRVDGIAALDITVQPSDDKRPDDVRAAKFVEWAVDATPHGWAGLFCNMLKPGILLGWSAHEITMRKVGRDESAEWAGMWTLKHARPLNTTRLRLQLDVYRNVLGVVNTARGSATYPRRKCMIYTHGGLFGNPFGSGEAAAARRDAKAIDKAMDLWSFAIKVYGGPFLKGMYTMPERRKQLEKALEAARQGGWMTLQKGDEVEVINMATATSFSAFQEKVKAHTERVYMAVRGAYLPYMQGNSQGGESRGSSETSKSEGSNPKDELTGESACRTIERDLVPHLIVPNFPRGTGMPKIRLGGVNMGETEGILRVVKSLREVGYNVDPQYLHKVTAMPPDPRPQPMPGAGPGGQPPPGGPGQLPPGGGGSGGNGGTPALPTVGGGTQGDPPAAGGAPPQQQPAATPPQAAQGQQQPPQQTQQRPQQPQATTQPAPQQAGPVPPEVLAAMARAAEAGDWAAVDKLAVVGGDRETLDDVLGGPVATFAEWSPHTLNDGTAGWKSSGGLVRKTKPKEADKPAGEEQPANVTPKRDVIAEAKAAKAGREPGRQTARGAWQEAVSKGTTADKLPELAQHLRNLTRDELREMNRSLSQRLGGLKEEHVQRLLAHVGAKVPAATADDRSDEVEKARLAKIEQMKNAPQAKKPNPAAAKPSGLAAKSKAGSKANTEKSLAAVVKSYGGIDPNSHALKAHFGDMKEAMEYGLNLGMFKKGGRGFDQMAQELAGSGHLQVPEGVDPAQHLADQLMKKASSALYDRKEELQKAEEDYYAAMQAVADEKGISYDQSLTADDIFRDDAGGLAAHRGATAAATQEAASDPYGSGGEGVDTSFDFGHNVTGSDPAEQGGVSHVGRMASADHAAELNAMRPGTAGIVGGYHVTRNSDGSFAFQTGSKTFNGGTADDAANHIKSQWAGQQWNANRIGRALDRHDSAPEVNPFDPVSGARDAAERAKMDSTPHGVEGVSVDGPTRGRVGTVRRGEDGRLNLHFDDAPDEYAVDQFEPLEEQHSWRTAEIRSEKPKPAVVQKGLFDTPTTATNPAGGGNGTGTHGNAREETAVAPPANTLTDDDGEALAFTHPKAQALAGEINRHKAGGRDTTAAEVAMGNVHGMEEGLDDAKHRQLVARQLVGAHKDAVRLGKTDAAAVADELLTGEHVGAVRIGTTGETVPFNPVHHESDSSLSTGQPVTVERHGHRLDEGGGREYVVGKAKVSGAKAGSPQSAPPPLSGAKQSPPTAAAPPKPAATISPPTPRTPDADTRRPAATGRGTGNPVPVDGANRPGGDAGADAGSVPGRAAPFSPRVAVVRGEHTRPGDTGLLAASVTPHLKPEQAYGAALAVEAMGKHGGFLNADGTGVGKTRQQLAVAKTFADQGKKVLIVSPKQVTKADFAKTKKAPDGSFSGSFKNDSDAMGVPLKLTKGEEALTPGQVHLTTYENLAKIKGQIDGNTVVIWDESHTLKNPTSARSKHGKEINEKAHSTAFFTATPGDKATHIEHLARAGVFGADGKTKTFQKLGMELHDQHVGGGEYRKVWRVKPGMKKEEVARRLSGLMDQMTKDGLMIRRELGVEGVGFNTDHVTLSADQHAEVRKVYDDVMGQTDGNKAVALMAARHHQEHMKVPHMAEQVRRDLAAGRRPVVFAGRVNDVGDDDEGGHDEVKDALAKSGHSSRGTIPMLKEALIAAGIPEGDIAELHGEAKEKPERAMDRFQSGKAKVMLGTIQSGGVGVNLDDQTGDAPRSVHIMTPPFSANDMAQAIGRVHRLNTKSASNVHAVLSDTEIDRWNSALLQDKFRTQGAIVGGNTSSMGQLTGPAPDHTQADAEPFAWGSSLTTKPAHYDVPAYHNDMAAKHGGERARVNGEWVTRFPSQEKLDGYHAAAAADRAAFQAKKAAEMKAGGGTHVVTGNTYPHKEDIKRMGGRWVNGQWEIPANAAGRLPRGLSSRPKGGGNFSHDYDDDGGGPATEAGQAARNAEQLDKQTAAAIKRGEFDKAKELKAKADAMRKLAGGGSDPPPPMS